MKKFFTFLIQNYFYIIGVVSLLLVAAVVYLSVTVVGLKKEINKDAVDKLYVENKIEELSNQIKEREDGIVADIAEALNEIRQRISN